MYCISCCDHGWPVNERARTRHTSCACVCVSVWREICGVLDSFSGDVRRFLVGIYQACVRRLNANACFRPDLMCVVALTAHECNTCFFLHLRARRPSGSGSPQLRFDGCLKVHKSQTPNLICTLLMHLLMGSNPAHTHTQLMLIMRYYAQTLGIVSAFEFLRVRTRNVVQPARSRARNYELRQQLLANAATSARRIGVISMLTRA